jgi:hypothetical protein
MDVLLVLMVEDLKGFSLGEVIVEASSLFMDLMDASALSNQSIKILSLPTSDW